MIHNQANIEKVIKSCKIIIGPSLSLLFYPSSVQNLRLYRNEEQFKKAI